MPSESPQETNPELPAKKAARNPKRRRKPKAKAAAPKAVNAPKGSDQAELDDLLRRLSDLARRRFLKKPFSRDVTKPVAPFDFSFEADFSGRDEKVGSRAKELIENLDQHLDDAIRNGAAFRPGAVYSFFDERADAPSCMPSDPREVFSGYTETGLPRWTPMLAWALETEFDGVDALASEKPRPVVATMTRDDLIGQRLESFSNGDRAYDIRGQVAIGYYAIGDGESDRFAVSLQVIRSSTRSGVVRLGLNTLGLLPDGRPAIALLEGQANFSFIELHRHAQRRLAGINQSLRRIDKKDRAEHAATEAKKLLTELSSGVAQKERRKNWRTDHASERAKTGDRPTGMARPDVASTKIDRVHRDSKDGTIILLAPRGRVHVFTDVGMHVTSLHLKKAAIDQRLRSRRWQAMETGAAEEALHWVRLAFERSE